MKDTSPQVESRFIDMLMKKSGQERMRLGFSMFEMARRQVIASIKMKKPEADIREIRKGIFLRFYGHEFSPEDQRKILEWLNQDQIEVMGDVMAGVLRRKTPAERIRIGFNLWTSARNMLMTHLKKTHPEWDEEKMKKEVARRLSHGLV